jgi:hypothetical protein
MRCRTACASSLIHSTNASSRAALLRPIVLHHRIASSTLRASPHPLSPHTRTPAMPKNTKGKGGKNRRRGKHGGEEKAELTIKEEGQEYAQVRRPTRHAITGEQARMRPCAHCERARSAMQRVRRQRQPQPPMPQCRDDATGAIPLLHTTSTVTVMAFTSGHHARAFLSQASAAVAHRLGSPALPHRARRFTLPRTRSSTAASSCTRRRISLSHCQVIRMLGNGRLEGEWITHGVQLCIACALFHRSHRVLARSRFLQVTASMVRLVCVTFAVRCARKCG